MYRALVNAKNAIKKNQISMKNKHNWGTTNVGYLKFQLDLYFINLKVFLKFQFNGITKLDITSGNQKLTLPALHPEMKVLTNEKGGNSSYVFTKFDIFYFHCSKLCFSTSPNQ